MGVSEGVGASSPTDTCGFDEPERIANSTPRDSADAELAPNAVGDDDRDTNELNAPLASTSSPRAAARTPLPPLGLAAAAEPGRRRRRALTAALPPPAASNCLAPPVKLSSLGPASDGCHSAADMLWRSGAADCGRPRRRAIGLVPGGLVCVDAVPDATGGRPSVMMALRREDKLATKPGSAAVASAFVTRIRASTATGVVDGAPAARAATCADSGRRTMPWVRSLPSSATNSVPPTVAREKDGPPPQSRLGGADFGRRLPSDAR